MAAALETLQCTHDDRVEIAMVVSDDPEVQMIADIIQRAVRIAPDAFGPACVDCSIFAVGQFETPEAIKALVTYVSQCPKDTEFFPLVGGGSLNMVWAFSKLSHRQPGNPPSSAPVDPSGGHQSTASKHGSTGCSASVSRRQRWMRTGKGR